MSASDVESEERREVDVGDLLDRAEEQVRQGRVDGELLDAVRRLKPEDAKYLVDRLEKRILRYNEWHRVGERAWRALSKVEDAAMPRLIDYVRQVAGVDVPLKARRGWTDKVKELIKDITVESFEEARRRGMDEYAVPLVGDDYTRAIVRWERFREILKYVPAQNLLDRQNDSPLFIDFVEAAASVPGSYINMYVIGKLRDDERVTIDGVILPIQPEAGDVVWRLQHNAIEAPDEVMFIEVKGRQYIWLWWD